VPPERLVSVLREQSEALTELQEALAELVARVHDMPGGLARGELRELQESIEALARTSDENYRLARQKGIRLPGIGGKPHVPQRGSRNRGSVE